MELFIIGFTALFIAALTLFSGFGLGTVLMPVFALFFPVELAVAATAVVHFANNLFKLGLVARRAEWRTVARFGIPAALAAAIGAHLLIASGDLPALGSYTLGGTLYEIAFLKLVIGALIVLFALLELSARFQALAFPPRWLPLGGMLSGFFGGLSGNQGALRSAFLLKAGLSKEVFVATGVVCAVIVDASRLAIYGTGSMAAHLSGSREIAIPVAVGVVCAFIGSYFGKKLLHKVTLRAVQLTVASMMLIVGLGLMIGLL
ncbi:MAG: TSUP family transporter [Nitrosomonadales bacterium]|nr:TSUP family transporter [Nitrosomonadales bacterium]